MAIVNPERDYEQEMIELLKQWTPEGDFVPAIQGAKLFSYLMEKDQDLFYGWCALRGPALLTDWFARRLSSQRAVGLQRQGARSFDNAVKQAEQGDDSALRIFETVMYVIDDENTRRPLGDMTGNDCFFAADAYKRRSRENLMEEAFLRALGKKAGKQKIREVMTEERVLELRRSIVGSAV